MTKLSRLVSVLVADAFRVLDSRLDPRDFDFLNNAMRTERFSDDVKGLDPFTVRRPTDGNSRNVVCVHKDTDRDGYAGARFILPVQSLCEQ